MTWLFAALYISMFPAILAGLVWLSGSSWKELKEDMTEFDEP